MGYRGSPVDIRELAFYKFRSRGGLSAPADDPGFLIRSDKS